MADTVELKNFEYSAKNNVGLVRKTNEDYYGYFDTINGHVFVLCDGMGGHNAGEVAARIAVACVNHFFSTIFHKNIKLALKEAIEYANEQIIVAATDRKEYYLMGCTIVIVVVVHKKIYYAHLGDSRIYLFKNNNLQQITRDHSYIQTLIDKGEITKEKARTHPRRNEIERALGIGINVEPNVCKRHLKLSNNEILILCSDGLNSMLEDEEIEKIVNQNKNNIDTVVDKLIETTNQKGGFDNVTIQAIKFYDFEINHNILQNQNIETNKNGLKTKNLNNFFKNWILTILIITTFIFGYNIYINNFNEKTIIKKLHFQNKDFFEKTTTIKIENKNNIVEVLKKYNVTQDFVKILKTNYLQIQIQAHHKLRIYDEPILLEKKYKISIKDIYKANDLNKEFLPLGQEIIIPLSLKQ